VFSNNGPPMVDDCSSAPIYDIIEHVLLPIF